MEYFRINFSMYKCKCWMISGNLLPSISFILFPLFGELYKRCLTSACSQNLIYCFLDPMGSSMIQRQGQAVRSPDNTKSNLTAEKSLVLNSKVNFTSPKTALPSPLRPLDCYYSKWKWMSQHSILAYLLTNAPFITSLAEFSQHPDRASPLICFPIPHL